LCSETKITEVVATWHEKYYSSFKRLAALKSDLDHIKQSKRYIGTIEIFKILI